MTGKQGLELDFLLMSFWAMNQLGWPGSLLSSHAQHQLTPTPKTKLLSAEVNHYSSSAPCKLQFVVLSFDWNIASI
jgi:hypothetical protein